MKKQITVLFLISMCLGLSSCKEDILEDNPSNYIPKEGNIVVSIPKEYSLVYENDNQTPMLDPALEFASTVNGQQKDENLQYYSLLKDQEFRILTPETVINNKNSNYQTLRYWKLNDKMYEDKDSYLSYNVFTCNETTTIEPIYHSFRTVGIMLILKNDQSLNDLVDENNRVVGKVFDENENIIEQDNVKYLYGPYDFDPKQEAWTTNMDLTSFDAVLNDNKYTISVSFDLSEYLKDSAIIIKSLCKIDGFGYMINETAATQIIDVGNTSMEGTFYISLGENTLRCTFSNNM